MQDFLIEVINVIPSYYPFTEKDGSIGLADFYAQEPVSKEKKIHDDPVYRDFKRNCDVIGVPVGPCNKLIRGSNLDCIRIPPPVSPPPPICVDSNNGISLPCKCGCPASCLYRSGRQSDYIEDWDRQELLNIIDAVRSFPQVDNIDDNDTSFDDSYNREITHQLAGNAYWIGLPPSCDGIWITIVDCEGSEFAGFYELSSPTFGNSVHLKGRGQRIKILGDDGLYKKYQVYYSYEFEHKLEIRPPGEMTFKLADSNIVENAENDDETPENFPDNYSRFCYDEFVKFTTRNCISFTDQKGSFNNTPCVCDDLFNTDLDPHVSERYVLRKTIPSRILNYGVFSIENEETGYCMNAAFERDSTVEGVLPSIDPLVRYQYYDAFSGKIIEWDQINSDNLTWEDSDNQEDWYSWREREAFNAYVWDSTKIKENCYECLTEKKNQNNRIEVPPCENVMCGRIEVNASPDGSLFDAWEAADGPESGYKTIDSNQILEWDMFSKFGFPTLTVYNPSASNNENWYDEMQERFVESNTFVAERNQFTIPCFPTLGCPDSKSRVGNIIDISIPCSSFYNEENEIEGTSVGAIGDVHKIYVGVDYRPTEGCVPCSDCTPSGCCHSQYGFYEIVSSSIGKSFYYPIYSESDDVDRLEKALEIFQVPYLQCNNTKCTPDQLEIAFDFYLLNSGTNQDEATEEEIEEAIQAAIQECESTIEQFDCDPSVNEIDTSKITRVSDGVWEYDGKEIEGCTPPPGITTPFNCVYEIKPIRPSATYWSDVNVGQCEVNRIPFEGCGLCSRTWEKPRTDPVYAVGSGQDGCPATFCNKCANGTKSICSCCGVNRIESLEQNPLRVSQSVMNNCESCTAEDPFGNSECCPECCSLCNENGEDLCGEVVEDPNWKSNCETDPCGWCYWDFVDCGLKNSIYIQELKGDLCIDGNACSPTLKDGICEYKCIDESCDPETEYPGDDFGDSNGGFGSDGSFKDGGGLGL